MAITKKWAANGIKSPIPNDPQGDNLVNYDEGFTTLYRTPIKDGGKPIGLDTFNQLMYDITDEVIENKGTLNQVAQQVRGIINDTQTSLTTTWSSQLIDNKLSAAAASIIDDSQTTGTLTWSSLKISAEIGQGGGSAVIDDNTITTDKVWSSFKTNQMVKGGKTISITNFQTKTATADTEFVNNSANAQVVNLNVKVKTTKGTTQGSDQYLGDIVVYYNSTAQEVLRESVISQNITGAPNDEITSALGSVILDAQDTLLVKGEPATLWTDTKIDGYTANLTTEAPEPEPLGEGLIFTAQASSSSVTLNKQGTPTELQLEYQTIKADVTSGWQPYTLGTTIDLDANDKVAFRNTGTQTITQTASNYHYFTMAGEIKPENSMSFLFDSTGTHDSIGEYECYKMFSNCSALAEMPDLPATNIAANGYANMFEGCTKLKTIKPLNATTLGNYAYKEMFKNCSGLIISEGSGETSFLTMPATAPSDAATDMFIGTGGAFVGTPAASTSYFYNASIPTQFLRFTAEEDGASVAFRKSGSATPLELEFKKNDDSGWSNYTLGTNITLNSIGDFVDFRNRGDQSSYSVEPRERRSSITTLTASLNTGTTTYYTSCAGSVESVDNTIVNKHYFTITKQIKASGDIAAIFSKNGIVDELGTLACAQMFKNCSTLTEAPNVSGIKKVGGGAFFEMFAGCSALRATPQSLPSEDCGVFNQSKNYDTRKSYSVSGSHASGRGNFRFKTENTIGAYERMFMNCSSLSNINLIIHAKNIGANAFKEMFKGCAALNNCPNFAHTLEMVAMAGYIGTTSYETAFSGSRTRTVGSTTGWGIANVALGIYDFIGSDTSQPPTGSFYDVEPTKNKTQQTGAFYGMFEGCTSLINADFQINFTEASTSAYTFKDMFKNCSSLTTPPKFIGDRVGGDNNFADTFNGCSALNVSQGAGTTKFFTLTSGGGSNMFLGTAGSFKTTASAGEYYYN